MIFEPNKSGDVTEETRVTTSIFKRPSAWLPIGMSGAALAILVIHLARYGVTHESDEGTSAHLFQLLMGGQLFAIGYFALRWIPENPKAAAGMLCAHFVAAVPPFALLYWFEHSAR